jgi:hypothetical protein
MTAAAASETHMATINAEFDLFAPKVVQSGVQEILEVTYKPIATNDQSDLELNAPTDSDYYIDSDIHIFVTGQLVFADGKALDSTDHTGVTNNLLYSLFSQCSVTLNGTPITQSTQNYSYRAMLETLLTYGIDASNTSD